jgi:sterol desaturase/sphingolipid hydroxylase (fatty acid hydroxylase superfamily)
MILIVVAILTFLVVTLFGHIAHWCLHQPWAGKVHQAHLTHHIRLYPPSDFMSVQYRDAGKDATPKFFILTGAPLILAPIILCGLGVIHWPVMLTILLTEAVVGYPHNYLHDAFHIQDHWMSRVWPIDRLFKLWVELHYIHHVDMTSNYGIYTFLWDKVFGTFRRS